MNNFTSQTRLVESSTFKAPDSQYLHFSLGMQTLVPTDGSPMPPHLRPELEKMLRRLFRALGIREKRAKNGGDGEMEMEGLTVDMIKSWVKSVKFID